MNLIFLRNFKSYTSTKYFFIFFSLFLLKFHILYILYINIKKVNILMIEAILSCSNHFFIIIYNEIFVLNVWVRGLPKYWFYFILIKTVYHLINYTQYYFFYLYYQPLLKLEYVFLNLCVLIYLLKYFYHIKGWLGYKEVYKWRIPIDIGSFLESLFVEIVIFLSFELLFFDLIFYEIPFICLSGEHLISFLFEM